jgi:hypothetical protein
VIPILEAGARVLVNDCHHAGTVRAHFVADLSRPDAYGRRPGPDLFYVVSMDIGQWLGGDSCESGWAYVRELVVHCDGVDPIDPRCEHCGRIFRPTADDTRSCTCYELERGEH